VVAGLLAIPLSPLFAAEEAAPAAAGGATAAAPAAAPEERPTGDFTVGAMSQYIWRG